MLDVADADPVALVGPRYVAVNQLVQPLPRPSAWGAKQNKDRVELLYSQQPKKLCTTQINDDGFLVSGLEESAAAADAVLLSVPPVLSSGAHVETAARPVLPAGLHHTLTSAIILLVQLWTTRRRDLTKIRHEVLGWCSLQRARARAGRRRRRRSCSSSITTEHSAQTNIAIQSIDHNCSMSSTSQPHMTTLLVWKVHTTQPGCRIHSMRSSCVHRNLVTQRRTAAAPGGPEMRA